MATLTESSIIARRSLRYFIYAILSILALRFVFFLILGLYKTYFPEPPPAPTVAFGKLKSLPFPNLNKHNLQFTLETPDGGLPVIEDQIKVFFMPKVSANLLSLDFSKDKAQKMGFSPEAQQISDTIYRFYHKVSPSTLEIDIITGSFSISYDLGADPTPLSVKPPLPEMASASIKSFLSSSGMLPADLTGENKYKYLKTQAGGFIPAVSLSDGNLIRVDMFRSNINEKPVVTSSMNDGNTWFMLSGLRDKGRDIIAGEYHYFPVDESQSSTYPLKTPDQAWKELQSGNFYPASLGTSVEGDNIKIRKVYIAYYDAGVYTEFMQPVFVFEGDKEFVGYVPAISSDYYGD